MGFAEHTSQCLHEESMQCRQMARVAIVGCAGRGEDARLLSASVYERMVAMGVECVDSICESKYVHLVSGGAAWSDHVAVTMFLTGEYAGLTLHLPCAWTGSKYLDNGASTWKQNPGRSANRYHTEFSCSIGRSSFGELNEAINRGAEVCVHRGFFARNSAIANTPYLIAFSTLLSAEPTRGGTLDTWKKATGMKWHVAIRRL
jgi:hypothetical protein